MGYGVDMETSAPLLGEPLPVELMNTLWADRAGVHDALEGPGAAAAWLRAVGPRLTAPADDLHLGPGVLADPDRLGPQLQQLRDALRRLAAEATGDPRPAAVRATGLAEALAAVNRAARAAPSWSALTWDPGDEPRRLARTRGPAGAAALSALAEDAIALLAGTGRHELRACLAPGCVLYFLKAHPRREWCSAACGNRARGARHYQRHHGTTP